jgi:hypothetical protein
MKSGNTKKKQFLKRLQIFDILESEERNEPEEREKKTPSTEDEGEEIEREFTSALEEPLASSGEVEKSSSKGAKEFKFPEISVIENYPEQPEVLIKVKYKPKGQRASETLEIKAVLSLNYLPEKVKEGISETFYRLLRAPGIKIKTPQGDFEFERVTRLLYPYIESIFNEDPALSSKIWRKINGAFITAVEKSWRNKSSSLPDIKLFRQGVVLILYEEAFFLPYYSSTIHPGGKIEKLFGSPPPSEILKLEIEKIEAREQTSTNSPSSNVVPRNLTLGAFLWALARKIGAIIEEPATLTIEQPPEIRELNSREKQEIGWKLIQKFLVSNFVQE